ncbi:MAG: metal-sensing transcriptional repressor [Gammaproteobacteria bacterium]
MQGHNSKVKTEVANRLSRVEGQIRGIRRLIEEEADCDKVAQQMAAARKALDKAFHEMLACMVEQDVLCARETGDAEATMTHIRNLLSRYG